MQLHPSDRARAAEHTITSLSRGYIGLDFEDFWSDLTTVTQVEMAERPSYWHFANTMVEGDFVLIMVRDSPFALVEVTGPYNYLKEEPKETLGVWFRHFRRVKVHGYYGDWDGAPECTTASFRKAIERVENGPARGLIDEWRQFLEALTP